VFLAEAIREKDYFSDSISRLQNRIMWLAVASKESDSKLNKELLDNKLEELDKLYKEYQKYSIIVTRAKATIKIKLNEDEFSIADAENLVEVLKYKLEFFTGLVKKSEGSDIDPSNIICINFKSVDKNIEALRKDIRIIESGISKATWSIEI
jgi:hypothetical protein